MRAGKLRGGCSVFIQGCWNSRAYGASLAGVLVCVCGTAAGGGPVAWKNPSAVVEREHAGNSVLSAAVLRGAAAKNTVAIKGGYVLVELSETPDSAARVALSQKGLELLSPVSATAYFARVDGNADIDGIGGVLVDARAISRSQKIHPLIQDDEMPLWSVVGGKGLRINDRGVEGVVDGGVTVAAYVMMHRDVDAGSAEVGALVRSYGGRVQSVVMSMNTVVVEMPYALLKEMADDPRVQWVEPPLPPMESNNASNRVLTQVNVAQSAPYSLDGTGVTVLVYDGGSVRASHADFSGRVTNIDSSATNFHSTHVAGTIGGDGSTSLANRGMAPGVNILAAGFEVAGGLSEGFLYTDPGDLEADYTLAMSLGASISNNSIGSNVAQNGYPCAWHGDYGITAGVIDNVIRGSLGEAITVFWAAGNERGSGACGTGYGTTAPPGNNKNAISIGAVNSNDDSMTSFSSWGPSDDGRIRPVLSAPGCQVGSDNGVTSTGDGSDSQYISLCGTSMASPTAAGIGALILQDFRVQFPLLGEMSNQLMKVILIEGAVDILNAGPDFQSGYGSIRAVDSIDFMRTGNFREDSLVQGGSSTYTVNVEAGDPVFRVTVAWDDPAGAPNVSPELVNDLDLIVIDPLGNRHYPWTLNPASPSAPAVRNSEDHLNNIEQVQVENPVAGVWQVQVVGGSVIDGPQSFALASAIDIGAGFLSLTLSELAPESVLAGTPMEVTALVSEGVDTLVPGSIELNYRFETGDFVKVEMGDNGDGSFTSMIPGADCGQFVEFYVSSVGELSGEMFSPQLGPLGPSRTEVGEVQLVFSEDFESDNGWTVSGDAADGQWTRGVPVDCSSRGAPGADSDGSGVCWITDNDAGNSCNSDVDDGTTTLTSPVMNMAEGGEFTFDYWFADIPTGEVNGDQWLVEVSTNGGSDWAVIRSVTSAFQGWRTDTIRVGEEVVATSTMRFRFHIDDVGTQNVIEGGLDHVRITRFVCEDAGGCVADMNGDGVLDFLDISAFVSAFGIDSPEVDFTGDGNLDFLDISMFIASFNDGCP